jgi:hypothetical protein
MPSVNVEIRGKESVSQAARQSYTALQALANKVAIVSNTFNSLGAAISILKTVASAVDESVKTFAAIEKQTLAFGSAIEHAGQLTGGASSRLSQLSGVFSKLTGETEGTIQGFITLLATSGRTEEQIGAIMQVSADAAASGKDFSSTVNQLNKTFGGLSGELGETIPELKNLTAEQLRNGDAVKLLGARYKGLSNDLADSSDVSLKNYANAMEKVQGILGREAENFFKPVRDWITSIADEWSRAATNALNYKDVQDKVKKAGGDTNALKKDDLTIYLKGKINELETAISGLEKTKIAAPEKPKYQGTFFGKDAYIKGKSDYESEISALSAEMKGFQLDLQNILNPKKEDGNNTKPDTSELSKLQLENKIAINQSIDKLKSDNFLRPQYKENNTDFAKRVISDAISEYNKSSSLSLDTEGLKALSDLRSSVEGIEKKYGSLIPSDQTSMLASLKEMLQGKQETLLSVQGGYQVAGSGIDSEMARQELDLRSEIETLSSTIELLGTKETKGSAANDKKAAEFYAELVSGKDSITRYGETAEDTAKRMRDSAVKAYNDLLELDLGDAGKVLEQKIKIIADGLDAKYQNTLKNSSQYTRDYSIIGTTSSIPEGLYTGEQNIQNTPFEIERALGLLSDSMKQEMNKTAENDKKAAEFYDALVSGKDAIARYGETAEDVAKRVRDSAVKAYNDLLELDLGDAGKALELRIKKIADELDLRYKKEIQISKTPQITSNQLEETLGQGWDSVAPEVPKAKRNIWEQIEAPSLMQQIGVVGTVGEDFKTKGGTELGNIFGDLESFGSVFGDAMGQILPFIASLESVNKILNPFSTILGGFLDVLGPMIDIALKPLVSVLEDIGRAVGQFLFPAFQLLAVGIEYVAAPLQWLADALSWTADQLAIFVYNIFNPFSQKSYTDFISDASTGLDARVQEIWDWNFDTITKKQSTSSSTNGSNTTVSKAPDIYNYLHFHAPIIGAAGMAEVGEMVVEAIQAYVGAGGKITFKEA